MHRALFVVIFVALSMSFVPQGNDASFPYYENDYEYTNFRYPVKQQQNPGYAWVLLLFYWLYSKFTKPS